MAALDELISRSAGWHRNLPAVVDRDRVLTFADVEERSNRLANCLASLSEQRGGRVGMLMPNRLEWVEIDFAIIKAAKVKVPVNTRLRTSERAFILADSGAETLVFDSAEEESVAEISAQLPELRHLIRIGPGRLGMEYQTVLREGAAGRPKPDLHPEEPSLILYTSGTTGRPKGAVTTNRSRLTGTINMLANEIDPRPGDAMAHVGSMAHGSGSKILAHFVRGSRNVPVAKWDPEQFLTLTDQLKLTHSFMVPTMIHAVAEAASGSDADWSSLRAISYGGAPIPVARLTNAVDTLGSRLVQVYGSCEAPHPVLVLGRVDHQAGGAPLASAGREIVGVRTMLVDPAGQPCPDGEAGELLVQGANVMSGYWGQPDATAEVFAGAWYRTGDIARRDDDGYVYIVDRARDLIISGGFNVYPAELEAVLTRHPGVADAAVVGVPDDRWGEAVLAVVVRKAGTPEVSAAELIDLCGRQLAGYKKPKTVDFVAELPRGSTGKILRRQIRDAFWEGRDRRV
jgi:long-chain acyl-CoA synthetase